MKSQGLCLALIAPCLILAASAPSDLIQAPVGPLNPRYDGNSYTIGNEFTVGASPITINALGVWDSLNDGLRVNHSVGIWTTTSTTAVATATVQSGTASVLSGGYRYAPISPVTLSANTTYRIGVLFPGGTSITVDAFNESNTYPVTAGPGLSLGADSRYAGGSTLTRPDTVGGGAGGRWAGGNGAMTSGELGSFAMLNGPSGGVNRNDYTGSVGFEFRTGSQPLTLTGLGFYDKDTDGLLSSHQVGLWRANVQAPVATATVPAGAAGQLVGQYRYQALSTPITLLPDTVYWLSAETFAGGDVWQDRGANPAFTVPFDGYVFGDGVDTEAWAIYRPSTFGIPTNRDGSAPYSDIFSAPNLMIADVPEPVTLTLVLFGLGGMGGYVRRRR